MVSSSQHHDGSQSESIKILTREISFDPGYELAFFTLRRVHDGHLQSYMPLNSSDLQVRSIPIAAQLSRIEALEKPTEDHPPDQNGTESESLSPHLSLDNPPYSHTPNQQTYNIPLRGSRETVAQPDDRSREPSVATLERHAHARNDGYTDVCGLRSPAISTPVKKYNPGKGEFRCPRCESNFTRPKSVKDHFPYCILKCGNPQALRFTDHPSMAQTEAAIQRRTRASREPSTVTTEDIDDEDDNDDAQMDGHSPEIELKEMSEALARTSLQLMEEDEIAHDGTKIKTEFVFGADIPRESIETPSPEHQSQPGTSHAGHRSLRIATFRGQRFVAQTPDWQLPQGTNPRSDSSTTTPHSNPWNIGVPGSAAEHAMMDMRATAPFEGWPQASQTPEPTSLDGTQYDGRDDFMDRRSHFSPTPAASQHPERLGVVYEDSEMEE